MTARMLSPPATVTDGAEAKAYFESIWGDMPPDWQEYLLLSLGGASSLSAVSDDAWEGLASSWRVVKKAIKAINDGKSVAESLDYLNNDDITTTLKIVPAGSVQANVAASGVSSHALSAVSNTGTPTVVEFYIYEMKIGDDVHDAGLHLIGDFGSGVRGGHEHVNNRGWYEVTKSQSYSVVNDFQVAKYSGTTLFIYGVKVDGVEYMEFTGWPDEAIRLQASQRASRESGVRSAQGLFWERGGPFV